MPWINYPLDSLRGATDFPTLDLSSGYGQIHMADEVEEKAAFTMPDGLYQYNVLP